VGLVGWHHVASSYLPDLTYLPHRPYLPNPRCTIEPSQQARRPPARKRWRKVRTPQGSAPG